MKCWEKAVREAEWIDWQLDDENWCDCFATCANPEPEIEVELEVQPEPEVKPEPVADAEPEVEVEPDPEVEPEVDEWWRNDDYTYTAPKCEGLYSQGCDAELQSKDSLCGNCRKEQERQEYYADLAAEEYDRRDKFDIVDILVYRAESEDEDS